MVALPDMGVDAAIAEYAQDSWNSRSRFPVGERGSSGNDAP